MDLVADIKEKAGQIGKIGGDTFSSITSKVSSDTKSALLGTMPELNGWYFPPEIVGGCIPRVAGEEEKLAWQAAAEACDTERLHMVWSARGEKIWYLAVRSSDLGSRPNTWCPLAALLPGMEAADSGNVLYIYIAEEAAMLMTVTSDGLLLHRGTTAVIQAKADKLARELGGARIIGLVPDFIDQLLPVPWHSHSLLEDRARRFLTMSLVVGGMMIALLSTMVWLMASLYALNHQTDLTQAKQRSAEEIQKIIDTANNLRISPIRVQMAAFMRVNDELLAVAGWLKKYEIGVDGLKWEAQIPRGVTNDRIVAICGTTADILPDGFLVRSLPTSSCQIK